MFLVRRSMIFLFSTWKKLTVKGSRRQSGKILLTRDGGSNLICHSFELSFTMLGAFVIGALYSSPKFLHRLYYFFVMALPNSSAPSVLVGALISWRPFTCPFVFCCLNERRWSSRPVCLIWCVQSLDREWKGIFGHHLHVGNVQPQLGYFHGDHERQRTNLRNFIIST